MSDRRSAAGVERPDGALQELPIPEGCVSSVSALHDDLSLAAHSLATVLISAEHAGERARWAEYIHQHSACRSGPLVAVSCLDHPPLSQGAPVGGRGWLTSCFDRARGGTLFLDEIDALGLDAQVELFALLDARSIHPLMQARQSDAGSATPRVIAGASRSLRDAIAQEAFVEPLFYRLNVIHFAVPSSAAARQDTDKA